MAKQAISVTLDADNLTWLRARARTMGVRSVSELLDQIVTAARYGGAATGQVRSVVGTVDIDAGDPELEHADTAVRALFETSLRRPFIIREPRTRYRARKKTRRA
jgi:hypothetical protein